jgi:hypothetical protein
LNNLSLSTAELDYIFSPEAIRAKAAQIFNLCQNGQTAFAYHPEKLEPTVNFVLSVIKKNYPSLEIPFHSRWGHFKASGVNRVAELDQQIIALDPMERARIKLDLVIASVLLDAGAGDAWSYREGDKTITRSEGLGVASFRMFMAGAFSSDGKSLRCDGAGLSNVTPKLIEQYFQVSLSNPLVGVEGRAKLLNSLGSAMENKTHFISGRPGNIVDYLSNRYGKQVPAKGILRAVIDGIGNIWPGRIFSNGINLGDTWQHSKLGAAGSLDALVPFHKLSQWMTYSLIEPILESGLTVTGVHELTGLAEYRNGGLILDSGLVTLRNPDQAKESWTPDSDLIIEWRALTVYLLDQIGSRIQVALGKDPQDFPLAKVLEGGTWWAGRNLAKDKRAGGGPPLQIKSDGTVF